MLAPQNICFFNTTLFWGGGEKWHFEAAQKMATTNNNTFFVCDGSGELSKKLKGLEVIQFSLSVGNLTFLNPIKVKALFNFFTENNIGTVIFNSPKDLKIGGLAAKKAGVKNVVYRRGIAVEVKKSRINLHLFKNVVTHFIFNSKATKELLQKHYKSIVDSKKCAIIYNAIAFPSNTELFNDLSENTPFIIGNAGRLVEQKAQYFLIDIGKELKNKGVNFKIVVAGDGPLKEELKKQIEEYDLCDQIEILGFVEDMKSFMGNIDIFVSTAIWEGFGFVIAEAMVAKKPVLAFNVSSNPELVKESQNGFLIPLGDTGLFAEKIACLTQDKKLRVDMGLVAYRYAMENFESDKQFRKLLEFICC